MLYFLIFLIPFMSMMFYMASVQKKLRKRYNDLSSRLKVLVNKLDDQQSANFLKDEWIITDENIKQLEKIMHEWQTKINMNRFPTVANTFIPKRKKLLKLEEAMKSMEDFEMGK